MDDNKTVTAHFDLIPPVTYTLAMAVSPDDSGTTTPAIGDHDYLAGTEVPIEAFAEDGFQFANWTGDVADPSSATTTVTMDASKTVTANFTQGNIITAAFLVGYNNPNCSGGSFSYYYELFQPELELFDEIKPLEPWLTVTNPNLKSVHFFVKIADDSTTVSYRYTNSIIKEDVDGVISPIEENWEWSIASEDGTLTGPVNGEYVFSSTCIEIPGDPPSDYPHHFYIEISIGEGNNINTYMVHLW